VVSGVNAVTADYSYDESGQLLGEYSATGTAQAEYIYLDSTPIAVVKGTSLAYVETDHLGTPRQVFDPATNNAVWTWDGLASTFGVNAPNQAPTGGATYTLNLRFPGQYYDAETGLNYNYFREYEPTTGRYVESDPVGLGGGGDTYAYATGNPLGEVDPSGRFSFTSSCDYTQRVKLTTAFLDMWNDLLKNACGSCPEGGQCMSCDKVREIIQWLLTSATFHCDGKDGGSKIPCGIHTTNPITNDITLYPTYVSFEWPLSCGCLKSTILHETLHHLGNGDEPSTRSQTKKCISCARGD